MTGDGDENTGPAVMVMKESSTGYISCHMVKQKGIGDGWIVKRLVQDIETIGIGDMIMKGDQEASITAVIEAVKKERKDHRTITEQAPVGSSASNGKVERAIQEVEGQLRTMKSALMDRLSTDVSEWGSIMSWMTEAAGQMITKFMVGKDGRTAHERVRGTRATRPMAEFGEKVVFKPYKAGTTNKLEPRWVEGVWLTVRERSGENVIGAAGGIIKARSFKRVPVDERWDAEAVRAVRGYPWNPGGDDEAVPVVVEVRRQDGEPEEQKEAVNEERACKVYISKQDVQKFGETVGCGVCRAVLSGRRGPRRPPHTTMQGEVGEGNAGVG